MALDTLLLESGGRLLLEDGGRVLLESAAEAPAIPGGTARRSRPTWDRTTARAPASWLRTATRPAPTLVRAVARVRTTWCRMTSRPSPTWDRTTARAPASWPRAARRAAPTYDRTWRYAVSTLPTRSGDVLIAAVSDDRDYAFDLSSCPEIVGGATIASAQITGGTGLTIGTPAANAAPFDGIAAGKAVVVRIGGGAAGTTYDLACLATLSTGSVVVVPARLKKVADRDS